MRPFRSAKARISRYGLYPVQLPVLVVASVIGVWLFSVQHRFEHTRWVRHSEWRFRDAAFQGSSHLRLPRILQWFTRNIGFHHIHHLNPRIANYRLQECHDAIPTRKEDVWCRAKAPAAGCRLERLA